jgi:murein DD-endopeptidase MepM/ murein hydrolase activator NlpD
MPRLTLGFLTPISGEFKGYFSFLYKYTRIRGYRWFSRFEAMKDVLVDLLYKRRGKYTRPFLHFGTIALIFFVITFGPFILEQSRQEDEPGQQGPSSPVISSAFAYGSDLSTSESEEVQRFRGGEVIIHRVSEGETLSTIAQKYGLEDVNTILWENNLDKSTKLKPGQELRILPVDGVRHKVARGETIYTIAKKYGLDEAEAQRIVNYPFNEFKNDETFELAIGQTLVIPGGVKPAEVPSLPSTKFASTLTPSAGSVAATGSFVWPAQGRITQRYSFYHKAFDIANHSGGPILAADSGTVIVAGWVDNTGYGNRVMIDHGNGYVTLYGHMSLIQVKVGQTVARGNVIGQMGSTGRSTGTHLHFEIRHGGVLEDPGRYLR